MIDNPQITHSAAQTTAVIHLTTPRSEIRTVMGPGYRELMAAVAARGMVPPGHGSRSNPQAAPPEQSTPAPPVS
jgi:hypothetical protein